jgi:hypothetical protein
MPCHRQSVAVSGNQKILTVEKAYIPISIVFLLAITFNFWMKAILDNNNYPVTPFNGYFRDNKNIFNLAKKTNDKGKRRYFFSLGLLNILSRIGLLIAFIFLVAGIIKKDNEKVCDTYKDFKKSTFNYLVVNKYIDSTQHSYPTLILKDKNGNQFKDIDLVSDNSSLFDLLSVGDSINKERQTDLVRIKNGKIDTTVKVDLGCD